VTLSPHKIASSLQRFLDHGGFTGPLADTFDNGCEHNSARALIVLIFKSRLKTHSIDLVHSIRILLISRVV